MADNNIATKLHQDLEEALQKLEGIYQEAQIAEIPFIRDSVFLALCKLNATLSHFGNLQVIDNPEYAPDTKKGRKVV